MLTMQRNLFSCVLLIYTASIITLAPNCYAQDSGHIRHSSFMPHGFCLNWDPALLIFLILANLGIALAYFAIPLALWYFVRHKRELPYPWIFQLFGMFIIACGTTHLMKIWTLYQPFYWAEASIDAGTALISLATALILWPLIPKLLELRGPKELEELNRKLEESIKRDRKITTELQAQAELLNLSHDAIVVRDLEGTIRYWNSGAEEVYGYTQKEALENNYYALLKTEFDIPREQIQKELIEKGRWNGELTDYRSDGQKIVTASRQALKCDEQGHPVAVLAISSDITEHKRAEQRRIALAEMERSNLELQQFAYIASHDLQEPLRGVAGCLQILEKKYKDKLDDDANDLINLAVDGAIRMRNLINALLSLSHVNSDGLIFQSTNLSEAVAITIENLAVHIKETKAQITYHDLPVLPGNKTQLVQLFQNLINNAIKFCKDKSPEIHIEAKNEQDHWLISVRDNGIGFEQKYNDHIFQPFKRLNTIDKYPGTGMGLTICKRIVERHNGKIWVESEIGKGTIFYFTLPTENKFND